MRAALRDAVTLALRCRGGNWALAQAVSVFAWIAVVLAVSCDGGQTLPMGPTPRAEPIFYPDFALECIRNDPGRFKVTEEQALSCTEDAIRRGLSSDCELKFNARFTHVCTDGWSDGGPRRRLSGDIRVRVSVSAFRAGRRFYKYRWEHVVGPDEAVWLCGGYGETPVKDCDPMMTQDVLRSHASGTFELRMHWNACWLEYSRNGGGLECNPDRGYPLFPSATD